MTSQNAFHPGGVILAAAFLALGRMPAAAAPGNNGTVKVDEVLAATYTGVDNPCTTGTQENITLQGTGPFAFHITGAATARANGTISVSLDLYSSLNGTDQNEVNGGSYTSQWRSSVWGTVNANGPRDFLGVFLVVRPNTPSFWFWVHFIVNKPVPGSDWSSTIVSFYPTNSTIGPGYDHVQCQ